MKHPAITYIREIDELIYEFAQNPIVKEMNEIRKKYFKKTRRKPFYFYYFYIMKHSSWFALPLCEQTDDDDYLYTYSDIDALISKNTYIDKRAPRVYKTPTGKCFYHNGKNNTTEVNIDFLFDFDKIKLIHIIP